MHMNSEVHLIDSEASENQAGMGSGIAVSSGSRLKMERSTIKSNYPVDRDATNPYFFTFSQYGGGVVLLEGHLTMLEGSEISYNEAMYGGGVQVGAGSTLRGRSSFIGHNGGPTSFAGAQIFLGGGGWFHPGYGSADAATFGLSDPMVELFDMTIEHTCQWELLRQMWLGTSRITSSAFGYSQDWMQDPFRPMMGHVASNEAGIDRPVDFEGKALDIRNSRIAVSECADKLARRRLESSIEDVPPPATRRLQSMPAELGVGLPPDALPRCADQTVLNPASGALVSICGLEATCTDKSFLAPLPPSQPMPPLPPPLPPLPPLLPPPSPLRPLASCDPSLCRDSFGSDCCGR